MIRFPSIRVMVLILFPSILLNMSNAVAQSQEFVAQNLISDSALAGSSGRIAINSAAGNGSAQTNLASIGTGVARTSSSIESNQQGTPLYSIAHTSTHSEIGTDAFRGASGLISVNQSSGNGNTQANLAAIAIGKISDVSIEQLGRVSAPPKETNHPMSNVGSTSQQKTVIADSAFTGAQGIVQVNQLAGSGNSTANVFALNVSTGIQ